jgi:hypothetical protein
MKNTKPAKAFVLSLMLILMHSSGIHLAKAEFNDKKDLNQYAQQMALRTWETEETEKALSEKLRNTFDEAFTKMGIADDTVKGELFRHVAKETDFGTLLVSAQDGDLGKFASRCGKMAANAVIEKFYNDRNFIKNFGSMTGAAISGITNAVVQLSEGNAANAGKELSKAFINYFPTGRAIMATIEVSKAIVASWKDSKMISAYQQFKGLLPGNAKSLNQDDWDSLIIQIDPYIRQLQSEQKDLWCKVNDISRDQLDGDAELSERIELQTIDNLRKKFENRAQAEDDLNARAEFCQHLILGFSRDGLLTQGSFSFEFGDNMDDRLASLFKIRENILEIVGGKMPYEMGEDPERNLNTAISEWLVCGPEDRAGFYDWMKEKGYIGASVDESASLSPTDLSGNWILTWVMPDGSANEFPMIIQMNMDNTGIVSISGLDGTQTIVFMNDIITIENSWKGRIFTYKFSISIDNGIMTLAGDAVTYSGKKGSGTIGTATAVKIKQK